MCSPTETARDTVSQSYGGHSGGETPGPIPNPEAKPSSADGTALDRVWESRTPPNTICQNTLRPLVWGCSAFRNHPTAPHQQTRTHPPSARTLAPRPAPISRAPDTCTRMCDERGLPELGVPAGHATANREYEDKRARIRHPRAQSHPNQPLFRAHLTNARAFATSGGCLNPDAGRRHDCGPRVARHPDCRPRAPEQTRAHSPSARRIAPRTLTIPRAPDTRARIRDGRGLPEPGCRQTTRLRPPSCPAPRLPPPSPRTNARAFAIRAQNRAQTSPYSART
jgi:hypothetical protein